MPAANAGNGSHNSVPGQGQPASCAGHSSYPTSKNPTTTRAKYKAMKGKPKTKGKATGMQGQRRSQGY